MCRIAGIINKNASADKLKQVVIAMRDTMANGGPDGYGFYVNQKCGLAFGHRRLSILDLSETLGKQPMLTPDQNFCITFNGEIYNFKEIRTELEHKGYTFASQTDTEVVLKSYQCWGANCIYRFIGMFAFAIYDKSKNTLILCRDRVGVKPLYYYFDDNIFMFSSEVRAFHQASEFNKSINLSALDSYFKYGYVPAPNTIYKNTYKLPPGSYLEMDLNTMSYKIERYWDILDYYNKPKLVISRNEALEQLETLLKSAFQYRMVSDVPVGLFLSGGYDSTLVASLLQSESSTKLKTFTIGFDESEFDESSIAAQIASHIGSDHSTLICSPDDALELAPKISDIFDEPFADASAIPTYMVSEFARRQVKVALSGDGGDEMFLGYNHYFTDFDTAIKLANLPPAIKFALTALEPIVRFGGRRVEQLTAGKTLNHRIDTALRILKAGNRVQSIRHKSEYHSFIANECRALVIGERYDVETFHERSYDLAEQSDSRDVMSALDFMTYLPDDVLCKVDRTTMHHGLEGREPLLDHRIAEFAARLPADLKIPDNLSKSLLKDIVHQYVPKALVDRPKSGFSIPLDRWLKSDLKEWLCDELSHDNLKRIDHLNTTFALSLRERFLQGREPAQKVWALLNYVMWYNKWRGSVP
jgi:asparagine synthase (glutamine-hydrolysing)